MIKQFMPKEFEVPKGMTTSNYILRPLTIKDAEKDHEAVMSNIEFLRKTPTPELWKNWPSPEMTMEKELRDLKWHEDRHQQREVFTYIVIRPDESECLGCVYIFPGEKDYEALIYFWVTEKSYKEGLNAQLYKTLKKWLEEEWPFKKVIFPGRKSDGSY